MTKSKSGRTIFYSKWANSRLEIGKLFLPRTSVILVCGLAISACATTNDVGSNIGVSRDATADYVDTFTLTGMLSGSIMKESDCVHADTSIWLAKSGHCIRYFHAGLKPGASNAKAIVWLHGGRFRRFYPDNSPQERQGLADTDYKRYGVPIIAISRPGYYGSSGSRDNQFKREYIEVVLDAVAEIKKKYKIESLFLGGSSLGARDVSVLLTVRSDVECAVLASIGGLGERRSFPKDFGPSLIQKHDTRRIILVGDVQDRIAEFSSQEGWFRAARSAGHNVLMFKAQARGRRHHDLRPLGRSLIGECARGAPDKTFARVAKEFR